MTELLVSALAPWPDFLVAAAGASAVLLGLVFIGLTIHLEGREEQPILVPMAIGSATTLFYPRRCQPAVAHATGSAVAADSRTLRSVGFRDTFLRGTDIRSGPALDLDRTAPQTRLPALRRAPVASLVLMVASLLLLVDAVLAVYVIGVIILLFLIVGTQNAWNLLLAGRFEVGAWTVSRTKKDDRSDR
ncbi:MAG TPA: hypothetical protein VIK08_10205 [Candidatus Limnocylindrales bacterium]